VSVAVLAVTGCSAQIEKTTEASIPPEPAASTTAALETAPESAPTVATPAPPEKTLLRVATVGDIMLGTDYPENHLPDDDGIGFLTAVTPYLQAADIAVGNLEGVLMDGGEPRKKCKNPAACYLFRTPARYADYLVTAGFDVMSLANNHARDFGEEGRTASMQNLANVGLKHTGREGDFAIVQSMGLRVAILGFAVTLNSNLLLDYDIAAETVRNFANNHDIVVITFHGGAEGRDATRLPFAEEEYYGEMRGDVVKFARLMVDSGADLVVGHGPHVVRGMELYNDRLIAYSLGNFATYYGISVEGIKGIAPILTTTLDEEGRFIEGQIISTHQLRPAGPTIDPDQQALKLIKNLSIQDFSSPGIRFLEDGRIVPESRGPRKRYVEGTLE
jgi:poly-gamma-glutamate capsule biosynthesis protein CapA/YwtB (metallophosphatase superfamily)